MIFKLLLNGTFLDVTRTLSGNNFTTNMKLPRALIPLALGISAARGARGVRDDARGVAQGPLNFGASSAEKYAGACPDYKQYAASLQSVSFPISLVEGMLTISFCPVSLSVKGR